MQGGRAGVPPGGHDGAPAGREGEGYPAGEVEENPRAKGRHAELKTVQFARTLVK